MKLPEILNNEINEYCKINDISNVDEFIITLIQKGFISEKYGQIKIQKPKSTEPSINEIVQSEEIIKELPKNSITPKNDKDIYGE